MDFNYKQKYLKYKNKYLKLQSQLIGGANCPQTGFHQHISECEQDTLLMLVLYSDDFSERIQTIFDSITVDVDVDEFITECVAYAHKNSNEIFIPLQIQTDADKALFYEQGRLYIKNIYDRYNNEKKAFIPDDILVTSVSKGLRPVYDSSKVIEDIKIHDRHKLYRRDSINESLTCAYISHELTNLNIMEDMKESYSHNTHNSMEFHKLNNISLINYYLTNFIPNIPNLPDKRKRFLSNTNFHFIDVFLIRELYNSQNILDTIYGIVRNLNDLYSIIKFSRNLLGIDLMINEIEPKDLLTDDTIPSGHYVGFIKCNGQEKFYDNNSVSDVNILPDEIELDMDEPKGDTDKLKKFPDLYMQKEGPLTMDFNWRKYLLEKIEKIIDLTIPFFAGNIDVKKDINSIIDNILALYASMSDLFKPGSQKVGRDYLKTHLITNMNLYFVNELDEDHIRQQYISVNYDNIFKFYIMYENKRIFDLIIESMTDNNYTDMFFKFAELRNFKLISRLLEEVKFPLDIKLDCIDLITDDIFIQNYNKLHEDVIKVIVSYSGLPADFKTHLIDKATKMNQDLYAEFIKAEFIKKV
jgi:hypothetical protein